MKERSSAVCVGMCACVVRVMLLIVLSRTVMNLPTVTLMNSWWNSPDNTQRPSQSLCMCWQECACVFVLVCVHFKGELAVCFCTKLCDWVQVTQMCLCQRGYDQHLFLLHKELVKCCYGLLKCLQSPLSAESCLQPLESLTKFWHWLLHWCITDGSECVRVWSSGDSTAECADKCLADRLIDGG